MERRLAHLEHNNRGKKPTMRPNSAHLTRVMVEKSWNTCPHNHLLVAYATLKKKC